MMGGRAAEQLIFKEVTTGAANDFDQATSVAKAMVVEYGMSDLGPINYGPTMDVTEWGKSYFEQSPISQDMMAKIDIEVKKIITNAYDKAVEIIKARQPQLDKVAVYLLKKESIDEDEFVKIVGKKLVNSLTR
jgi:cell division protease FtsH